MNLEIHTLSIAHFKKIKSRKLKLEENMNINEQIWTPIKKKIFNIGNKIMVVFNNLLRKSMKIGYNSEPKKMLANINIKLGKRLVIIQQIFINKDALLWIIALMNKFNLVFLIIVIIRVLGRLIALLQRETIIKKIIIRSMANLLFKIRAECFKIEEIHLLVRKISSENIHLQQF